MVVVLLWLGVVVILVDWNVLFGWYCVFDVSWELIFGFRVFVVWFMFYVDCFGKLWIFCVDGNKFLF